jgi:hypothetical protein
VRAHRNAIRAYATIRSTLRISVNDGALWDMNYRKCREIQVPSCANHQTRLAEIMDPLNNFPWLQFRPRKRCPTLHFISYTDHDGAARRIGEAYSCFSYNLGQIALAPAVIFLEI